MIKPFCLLLMVLGLSNLFAEEEMTLSEARVLAKETGKPVLIDFWSDN